MAMNIKEERISDENSIDVSYCELNIKVLDIKVEWEKDAEQCTDQSEEYCETISSAGTTLNEQLEICSKESRQSTGLKNHKPIHTKDGSFKCGICSKNFLQLSYLKLHEQLHERHPTFECRICFKKFVQLTYLRSHEQIHTEERPIQSSEVSGEKRLKTKIEPDRCVEQSQDHFEITSIAGATITESLIEQNNIGEKSSGLKNHGPILTEERSFDCGICSKKFLQLSYLKLHERLHERDPINSTFECRNCFKKFVQLSYLRSHEQIHIEEHLPIASSEVSSKKCIGFPYDIIEVQEHDIKLECKEEPEDCSYQSQEYCEIENNVGAPYGIEINEQGIKLECKGEARERPIEINELSDEKRLEGEREPEHSMDQYQECCETISATGNTKTESHKRVNIAERHLCKICLRVFSCPLLLKQHQRIHSTGERFKCGVCFKTFSQWAAVENHKRMHVREKQFENKIYYLKKSIGLSKLNHKQKQRRLKCDICLANFICISDLNDHKQIHTAERSFRCNICLKKFSQLSKLNGHKRVHSAKKQPFECDICLKKFSHQSQLNRHKPIHSAELPFECDICLKRFINLLKLNSHKRIHAAETSFECSVCFNKFRTKSELIKHEHISPVG